MKIRKMEVKILYDSKKGYYTITVVNEDGKEKERLIIGEKDVKFFQERFISISQDKFLLIKVPLIYFPIYYYSIKYSKKEIFKYFDSLIDPKYLNYLKNQLNESIFHQIVYNKDLEVLDKMIKKIDYRNVEYLNGGDKEGITPLMFSIKNGEKEIVKRLMLTKYFDPKFHVDKNYKTLSFYINMYKNKYEKEFLNCINYG